ncbi:sec1 family domain-containing protein 2-like isoform X2 [Halichondria panicea]|uniref:sec1 family domain-containing protein 2-like isoform X2 n=1 Tax=Halichondria panicea TaxID=6063 RepID=UPI00312B5ECD
MAFSQRDISISAWRKVADVCRDAAVFVDDNAAELLHWAGGLELLDGCTGMYSIYKELNSIAKDFIATAPYSCVVFVVTSFLTGECSTRINQLLADLQPLHCHVFTTHSQHLHDQWTPMPGGGVDGTYSHFGEFQALLRKWINREAGVRVSVSHLPLSVVEVCPGLLITPSNSSLFPLLPSAIEEIMARCIQEGDMNCSLEHLGQVDFDMLTRPFKMELKSLAESLNSLFDGMNTREELFSLGYTSRLVASQLAALPQAKARRKVATQRCSLLLVDRTLDLFGPTTHQSDTLVDRILKTLFRPSHTSSDVCVDMSPVVGCEGVKGVARGSLAQPNDDRAQQLLKSLVHSRQKESLMEVSRCLLDSLSQEGLSVKLTGKLARPSAVQLKAFLHQFREQPGAYESQRGVLQLACAVVQALEAPSSQDWDKMASIEKVLVSCASDPSLPSVISQVTDLVKSQGSPKADLLPLSALLAVCVAMFSLLGDTCVENQRDFDQMKESVTELVLQWRDSDTEFITTTLGIDRSASRLKVQGKLSSIFKIMEGIGECRNELNQFKHIHRTRGHTPYTPVLTQLADALFNPAHPELSDVDFHSQGSMSNIIKSSFRY